MRPRDPTWVFGNSMRGWTPKLCRDIESLQCSDHRPQSHDSGVHWPGTSTKRNDPRIRNHQELPHCARSAGPVDRRNTCCCKTVSLADAGKNKQKNHDCSRTSSSGLHLRSFRCTAQIRSLTSPLFSEVNEQKKYAKARVSTNVGNHTDNTPHQAEPEPGQVSQPIQKQCPTWHATPTTNTCRTT